MFCKYFRPDIVSHILKPEGISLRITQPNLLNDPFELSSAIRPLNPKDEKIIDSNLNKNFGDSKEAKAIKIGLKLYAKADQQKKNTIYFVKLLEFYR